MNSEEIAQDGAAPAFDRTDWLLALLWTLLALGFTANSIHWHTAPAEDALMLLRYANHLAAGAGITWNIGDHPVEGATDFLYMVVIAACIRLFHAGAIASARIFLLLCHSASVLLLFLAARKLFNAGRALASALAIYLMLGPGAIQAGNAFGVPFYALAAVGSWWFACAMVSQAVTTPRIWSFALLALLTGLIRPDGVLLAVFMTFTLFFALITSSRRREAYRMFLVVVAVFAVLGGGYFLWRLRYFGYLLPNPFYKKGGGHLYPDSLHRSTFNMFKMLFPVVPLAALALMVRDTRRRALFVFSTPVLFSLIWVLLTNENNSAMRFQYAAVPLTLMSVPYLTDGLRRRIPEAFRLHLGELREVTLAAAIAFVLGGMYWKMLLMLPMIDNGSGAYNIAIGLHAWRDRHYTMVVTEAGIIPYFSDWRAIDAWGLNDSNIVHDKRGLTPEYLDANHPAIIMFHLADLYGRDGYQRIWQGAPPLHQDPAHFMEVLAHYAATHNYELAARWGNDECNVHVWYVRRDLPEADAMIGLIRRSPHFFLDTQKLVSDFRNDPPPQLCKDPGFSIAPGS
ncbi:MAG TPA: hypothetical protein VNW54_02720 [Granulicella sp.]|jgi:arabinofuranosyltransferase|nr:hypothetical protein [Granulicella sp.]